uniref:Exocyst subunit Exo70 family protein n=1 Tax=Oryza barthii TaxID=65489 RepID=A0A0D3HTZ8_9ORYZ
MAVAHLVFVPLMAQGHLIPAVFMLNNTHAIVRRAVRSNLAMFLPPGWARAREERMEGYVKSYLDVSWAPIVSRDFSLLFNRKLLF